MSASSRAICWQASIPQVARKLSKEHCFRLTGVGLSVVTVVADAVRAVRRKEIAHARAVA
jgi:hypothetical protein